MSEPADRHPLAAGNVLELRAELARRGFTEYQTLAGWRPIADFDPYGMAPATDTAPAGANWRPQYPGYFGRINTDALTCYAAIVDLPRDGAAPGFVLGHFPIR